jgi:hypothetical protein
MRRGDMKMAIYIKIDKNDDVVVLGEDMKPLPESLGDRTLKKGKKVGHAFWFNENPTCVFIGGKWY